MLKDLLEKLCRDIGFVIASFRKGAITEEQFFLLVRSYIEEAHKAGRQSNLERLIGECGDMNLRIFVDGTPCRARNKDFEVSGSTPTEAVENLIKELEKKEVCMRCNGNGCLLCENIQFNIKE